MRSELGIEGRYRCSEEAGDNGTFMLREEAGDYIVDIGTETDVLRSQDTRLWNVVDWPALSYAGPTQ